MQQTTIALLTGTRGFFSPQLAVEGRASMTRLLESRGFRVLQLPASETPNGAIETRQDGLKYGRFLHAQRDEIAGMVISLPNFGDEIGVITALQEFGQRLPILVHAWDDELDKIDTAHRRDAFCGKLSVCNNLYQHGIPFTNTTPHTCAPHSDVFARDLDRFAGICRVVKGLSHARVGAIGARPAAFQTMRFSEKLLQNAGITVVPVDLSEIIARANALDDQATAVRGAVAAIADYGRIATGIDNIDEKITRAAKLLTTLSGWLNENDIDAAAVQCWTSIQENFGCSACLSMSMLSDRLLPCACEVDVVGAISMYALSLASGHAPAIFDWNNNYGDERDMCVAQHCSNYPKSFLASDIEIGNPSVLSSNLGADKCFGAIHGKAAPGPLTFFRISTDDRRGVIKSYIGEGEFTDDPFDMAGGIAVCRIPRLQQLLHHMCMNGFEHHAGLVRAHCADVIAEAVTTYLGWECYWHR